jgi:hypothetical protein
MEFCRVLVPPSPKFHDHDVGDPVDASVNCVTTFTLGADGENVKAAVGATPDADEDDPVDDEDDDSPPQAARLNAPIISIAAASRIRAGRVGCPFTGSSCRRRRPAPP